MLAGVRSCRQENYPHYRSSQGVDSPRKDRGSSCNACATGCAGCDRRGSERERGGEGRSRRRQEASRCVIRHDQPDKGSGTAGNAGRLPRKGGGRSGRACESAGSRGDVRAKEANAEAKESNAEAMDAIDLAQLRDRVAEEASDDVVGADRRALRAIKADEVRIAEDERAGVQLTGRFTRCKVRVEKCFHAIREFSTRSQAPRRRTRRRRFGFLPGSRLMGYLSSQPADDL